MFADDSWNGRGGSKYEAIEGVEVKDARGDSDYVLSEAFVERKRLLASYCVGSKQRSIEHGGQKHMMATRARENHACG